MSWIDLRAELPGLAGVRVHVVAADREPRIRELLAGHGFRVVSFSTAAVVDEPGFFGVVAGGLGLGRGFGANWDALRDVLAELDRDSRVAICWSSVDTLLRSDLTTFVAAVTMLDGVAAELATPSGTAPLCQLEVFLFSAGPGVR